MKALIYLIGLLAIVVLIVWFGYGITPENQWNWIKGYTTDTSTEISKQITDTENSAGKLKDRLSERFDEAADVYHGKEKEDPFQYNPEM